MDTCLATSASFDIDRSDTSMRGFFRVGCAHQDFDALPYAPENTFSCQRANFDTTQTDPPWTGGGAFGQPTPNRAHSLHLEVILS